MTPELYDYLKCALWSSANDDGEPLDDTFTPEDVAEDSIITAESDLHAFASKAGNLLDGADMGQVAHDLWLTRNGHGAGFWDRPEVYGGQDNADALSEIAAEMGEVYAYVGDDGRVYLD